MKSSQLGQPTRAAQAPSHQGPASPHSLGMREGRPAPALLARLGWRGAAGSAPLPAPWGSGSLQELRTLWRGGRLPGLGTARLTAESSPSLAGGPGQDPVLACAQWDTVPVRARGGGREREGHCAAPGSAGLVGTGPCRSPSTTEERKNAEWPSPLTLTGQAQCPQPGLGGEGQGRPRSRARPGGSAGALWGPLAGPREGTGWLPEPANELLLLLRVPGRFSPNG